MTPEMLVALAVEEEEYGNPDPTREETVEEQERGGEIEAGDEVEKLLEEISLKIMTADLNDLSVLGAIDARLEEITEQLQERQPASASLARAVAQLLEMIMLDEVEIEDEPLDIAARGISLLQRMQVSFARTGEDVTEDSELLAEIARLTGAEEITSPAEGEDAESVEKSGAETDLFAPLPASSSVPQEGADGESTAIDLSTVDTEIFADFYSEAEEHLEAAETTLLSLESNPTDDELLNTVFRSFHTIKGAAGFLNLHSVTRVAHAVEDVLDSARKKQLTITPSILDVVLESTDLLKELLEKFNAKLEGEEVQFPDTGAFLAKVAAVSSGEQPAVPVDAGSPVSSREQPKSEEQTEPVVQETKQPGRNGVHKQRDQSYVRVGTEKLDQLVNMVGELVIAQTQVTQNPLVLHADDQKLGKDISQLGKISNDIQEVAMALRMVPIRSTFERMARTVRDLARKCDKKVEMQMVGEDTELDKNVVEELVDPLTHMVRNAVDHGVESPAERKAAGKPENGVVKLKAYHKGGNIVIELQDDGKGLDREKLLKKAVDRGLARPGEELSDQEVFRFIFHPGFSTAQQVSDISGRGVGMDVVRRGIEKLRGKVEVNSELGRGSTFTIRLPLTLAIIDGMIIGVGEQRYILPLTSIVRSLRPREEDISTLLGQGEMVRIHEDLFPLVRLHQRFAINPRHQNPSESLVVQVDAEGKRYCLLVDELIGMQQVVIKALEEKLREESALSGCAILGDGQVSLILDPNGLVPTANGNGKTSRKTAGAIA